MPLVRYSIGAGRLLGAQGSPDHRPKGDRPRNQAACQMESRSWGNLTRRAGNMRPSVIGQSTGDPGQPVSALSQTTSLWRNERNPTGTFPLSNCSTWFSFLDRQPSCNGRVPWEPSVGSLSFGAPASTFHSDAHPLLLLPSRIVARRTQKSIVSFAEHAKQRHPSI